jgi:Cu-processing system permease protein
MLLVLPVSTGTVVVGKFLGRAAALVTALTLGLAPAGFWLTVTGGPGASVAYATYLFAAVGTGVAFLAVSVLVSTLAREKTRALGGVLLVWVLLVLVYDLVALAALSAFDLGSGGAVALVLANPADVMRVVVLALVPATSGGLATVVPPTALSLPVLAASLGGYVVGAVGLAVLASRRSPK